MLWLLLQITSNGLGLDTNDIFSFGAGTFFIAALQRRSSEDVLEQRAFLDGLSTTSMSDEVLSFIDLTFIVRCTALTRDASSSSI